ncbi:hypothetical protein [Cysteiniphilum litorale]|uniref:hypothetical protein n=1 Tax=Cysteiniphilum litorale TaxID=2056700 RepID=UPI003F8825C0
MLYLRKFFILTPLYVAGLMAGQAVSADPMYIKIVNDTNKTVYPLVTAMVNKQLIDCTGDPSIEKNGIAANTEVTINLASNCWNAGRVFIGQSSIVEMQPNAPLAPDSKYPYQLLEYTFSHGDTVDYDFSAVDAFSDIPVAMEAFMPTTSQPQIGWVGMNNQQTYYQDAMSKFSNAANWPFYKGDDGQPVLDKMPGAYNLFAHPELAEQSKGDLIRQSLEHKWFDVWYNQSSTACDEDPTSHCREFQQKVRGVINGFVENYLLSKKEAITPENIATVIANAQNRSKILTNIYGYVPFITAPDPKYPTDPKKNIWPYIDDHQSIYLGSDVTDLLRGGLADDSDHADSINYSDKYVLDPYTIFMHDKTPPNLGLQVYAFSIDDSIGNLYVPNYQGIVLDVGSTKNLPNTSPYTPPPPPSEYNINIGGGWATIMGNVCGKAVANESVIPLSFDKTCNVSLTMNKGQSADNTQFHLEKNSSANLVLSNCSGNICQQINVDAKNIYLPGAPA